MENTIIFKRCIRCGAIVPPRSTSKYCEECQKEGFGSTSAVGTPSGTFSEARRIEMDDAVDRMFREALRASRDNEPRYVEIDGSVSSPVYTWDGRAVHVDSSTRGWGNVNVSNTTNF